MGGCLQFTCFVSKDSKEMFLTRESLSKESKYKMALKRDGSSGIIFISKIECKFSVNFKYIQCETL